MKVFLAGGTGFIGRVLTPHLVQQGHSVRLLVRARIQPQEGVEQVLMDERGEWASGLDGTDAVINLAGAPIAGRRWTRKRREVIMGSRVGVTRTIIRGISRSSRRPRVLLNASAVGYYGNVPSGDVPESHPRGEGFLADVAGEWEDAARGAGDHDVRVVLLRTGIVLGRNGGALGKMVLPFRVFAGGPVGPGHQYVPWIHLDDAVSAITHCLTHEEVRGPVNIVGPSPVTMREFAAAVGTAIRRPSWLPVPVFALRLLLGSMSEVLTSGQKALPVVLERTGFEFCFSTLAEALADCLAPS